MASLNSISHLVGRKLQGLVNIGIVITIPTRPQEMAKRDHNRVVKDALKLCIQGHHKNTIPQHFERSAHGKYNYAPRSLKYMKEKAHRYGSSVDLVKTGKSRQRMMADPTIVIGGAAEGGKKPIEGVLKLKFDFTGGGGRRYRKPASRQAVTAEQLQKEIRAMTTGERREFATQFKKEYREFYKLAQYARREYVG